MSGQTTTRRILGLAIPALGSLIAQPIFVATDTAMVGHLGEHVLGGLAIGSMLISTVVGLMVFLAYTTTPIVARRLGAGDQAGAVRAGIDGMWLALGCAVVLLLVGLPLCGPVISLFTDDAFVRQSALSYLSISLWGLPGMLVSIAATGLLRGMQNTRLPLIVAVGGAVANVLLNWWLIFGAQLGIAGSALGTVIPESLMAAVYCVIAYRAAQSRNVSIAPGIGDPGTQLRASGYMLLRTVTLRVALVMLVWAAGQLSVTELAAWQIGLAVFNVLAFALDALAIAAQAMVGHDLGAEDPKRVYSLAWLLAGWGLAVGVVLAVVVFFTMPLLARAFTIDLSVELALNGFLWPLMYTLPVCGVVFVLDGVLIGAGDNAYLALAGVINLAVFIGALALVMYVIGPNLGFLWLCFGGAMMASRLITLVLRILGERWLTVGARDSV